MPLTNCPHCGSHLTPAELADKVCFDCQEELPGSSEYDAEIDDETED